MTVQRDLPNSLARGLLTTVFGSMGRSTRWGGRYYTYLKGDCSTVFVLMRRTWWRARCELIWTGSQPSTPVNVPTTAPPSLFRLRRSARKKRELHVWFGSQSSTTPQVRQRLRFSAKINEMERENLPFPFDASLLGAYITIILILGRKISQSFSPTKSFCPAGYPASIPARYWPRSLCSTTKEYQYDLLQAFPR